jgi:hypothetical protein
MKECSVYSSFEIDLFLFSLGGERTIVFLTDGTIMEQVVALLWENAACSDERRRQHEVGKPEGFETDTNQYGGRKSTQFLLMS